MRGSMTVVQNMLLRMTIVLGLTALTLYGSAHADYSSREDVRNYVNELIDEHGFAESELLELFSHAERKQSVLDAIARPAERSLKWYEYRRIFLQQPRIEQGIEFWTKNEQVLAAAEKTYGVAAEYVVAIIGVETRYGRVAGSYRVVDALATLAFDYPPRSSFFRKELTQYLLLAREEGKNPLDILGSYAGAMGYGQFIPSSFRAYAVDFDGDGLRDIWNNEKDAIGSVANYFRRHGWQAKGAVALQVEVTGDELDNLANASLNLEHTVGELQALGLKIEVPEADAEFTERKAALFRMELEDGAEYWLGLNNFYVITRYNRSRLYALAVYQLGQAIKARREQLTAQR